MTALWSFISTPLGRRIALIAAALLLGWALWWLHARAETRALTAAYDAGVRHEREVWRAKLAEAEQAARDTIRRKESAAYQRGIADEARRREADAAEAEQATEIVEEIVHVSESAAQCRFDDAAAAGLNRLRRPQ